MPLYGTKKSLSTLHLLPVGLFFHGGTAYLTPSAVRVLLPEPSYPQAESVAKARLWLPPEPAPRERGAWKICQT